MILKELTIGASRTFNLGNFESLRVEASATVELAEEDDAVAARAECLVQVRESLNAAYLAYKPKHNDPAKKET